MSIDSSIRVVEVSRRDEDWGVESTPNQASSSLCSFWDRGSEEWGRVSLLG